MPSKPVSASTAEATARFGRANCRRRRRSAPAGKQLAVRPARTAGSAAAQIARGRAGRTRGTSKNAAASTPSTAPNVLPAYSACDATCPRSRNGARIRSIAGSVAPIAAVAGSSSMKVPQKTTDHCHAGDGCAPIKLEQPADAACGMTNASARLHAPIDGSHAAYQRAGCALASMRAPSSSAPTASPPKNAATTASTAADSWPEPQRALLRPDDLVARAPRSRTPPSAAMRQCRARFPVSFTARPSAAERNAIAPGIEVRRNGVERQRDAPLAGIRRHRVHQVAGEQHHVAGLGRRADPLVRVVRARWSRRRGRS